MRLHDTLHLLFFAIPVLSRDVVNIDIDSKDSVLLERPSKGIAQFTSSKLNTRRSVLSALEHSPDMSPLSVEYSDCGLPSDVFQVSGLVTDPDPPPR